jgi:hypothetical protein
MTLMPTAFPGGIIRLLPNACGMARSEMLGAGFSRTQSFSRTRLDNCGDCQRASQEKYPRGSHGQIVSAWWRIFNALTDLKLVPTQDD